MDRLGPGLKEAQPLPAPGDHQGRPVVFGHDRLGPSGRLGRPRAVDAQDLQGLAPVGGEQRGPLIGRVVSPLGVDDHRPAGLGEDLDQGADKRRG